MSADQSSHRQISERIAQFNTGREAERLELKYRALRENPLRFFRGTAHLFWDDWARGPAELDQAPTVWSCGDLHLENFGSYRGDNRLSYFDINDFDDAALAPATRDPGRFLASLHVATAMLQLSRAEVTDLCRRFLHAYTEGLMDGKARWVERATARGMVRDLLHRVKQRRRRALLDTRTELVGSRRRLRIDGRHAISATPKDRERVTAAIHAARTTHDDPHFYDVLDVARHVAGTGSLGLARYVVLVRGRGSPHRNYLLDLKEAAPSALAERLPTATPAQPAWPSEARRVVDIQRRMQAIAPALLRALPVGSRKFVLRELQPLEDRLVLEHWRGKIGRLQRVMTTMGHVIAWAQLRCASRDGAAGVDALIRFAREKDWRATILVAAKQSARSVIRDWEEYVAESGPATRPLS